jgi:hypothetical protein
MQTGAIIQRRRGCQICSDPDLDEERFSQRESHWSLCLRIQRVLTQIIQHRKDVVIVTHSGWIYACFRLMGVIPHDTPFTPVRLASMHELIIPRVHSHNNSSGAWFCETSSDYAVARMHLIPQRIAEVPRLWRDRPSQSFGESKVVSRRQDWLVRVDVWHMEKVRHMHSFEKGFEPLMAISTHTPAPLACLRDLQQEHLGSLLDIDDCYPDETWIKFILYPPWAWRLHIHIHRKESHASLPCRNVHLLKDVIAMLQQGGIQEKCMLVYKF